MSEAAVNAYAKYFGKYFCRSFSFSGVFMVLATLQLAHKRITGKYRKNCKGLMTKCEQCLSQGQHCVPLLRLLGHNCNTDPLTLPEGRQGEYASKSSRRRIKRSQQAARQME